MTSVWLQLNILVNENCASKWPHFLGESPQDGSMHPGAGVPRLAAHSWLVCGPEEALHIKLPQ